MNDILLIEDNTQLQKYICEYLNAYEYNVHIIEDYDSILDSIYKLSPKLVLLDINLPKFDGFYYLKLIRKHYDIPVIIISARSEEGEQIRGMESGADDYVTKPFSIGVLLAKINAVIRRTWNSTNIDELSYGGLRFQNDKMRITYGDNSVELTKNEFKVLQLLVKNAGEIVTREELLEELWDDVSFVDDNTLTVNVTRVKKRLLEIGLSNSIVAKRGVGYVFNITNP